MTFLIENEYYKELCYLIDDDSKLICKMNDEYSIYKNIFDENDIIKIKEHIVIATLELSSLISSAYRYFMPALFLSDIQTKIYYKKNSFIKEEALKRYEEILKNNLLLNTKNLFPILEKEDDIGNFKWILDYDDEQDIVYYIKEKEDYQYSICSSSKFKIDKMQLITMFNIFEDNIRISKLSKELKNLDIGK